MSSTQPTGTALLREALYALSMKKRVPDALALDDVVRQYPQFAEELTDFAVELLVDSLREPAIDEAEAHVDLERVDPDLSRAISRFHNRVYALRQEAEKGRTDRSESEPSISAENPFANLNRAAFRAVVKQMDANAAFVAKLRDGQIRDETMTEGFKRHVAKAMGDIASVPEELVYAHLAAANPAAGANRQFYKAAGTPGVSKRQSFEEAVSGSGLTEEQQQRLLRL